MENCLKTQLKEVILNDNLIPLGFAKVHVCNEVNEERGILSYSGNTLSTSFPVGSKIVGEGTFSTGKNIVENGDDAKIPANSSFDVLIPKYSFFVIGAGQPNISITSDYTNMAINLDDFIYACTEGNVQSINVDTYGINLTPTPNGYASKGNLDSIIPYVTTTSKVSLQDSNVKLTLDGDNFVTKCGLLYVIVLSNDKKATGNFETFFSKLVQGKKVSALSTTGTGRIRIDNSGITSDYFDVITVTTIVATFNASNTVILTQGSTTVNYNIDTDTFSVQ